MATSGTIYYLVNYYMQEWQLRLVWNSTPNYSTFKSTINYKVQVRRNESTDASNTSVYSGQVLFFNADTGEQMVEHLFGAAGGITITVHPNTWTLVGEESFTVSHNRNTGKAPRLLLGGIFSNNFTQWTPPSSALIDLSILAPAATISSAPNFTDEENPTITYYNTGGSRTTLLQACISLDGGTDDIIYRDLNMNDTSYTFNLTEEERNILLNATLNGSASRKVRFYVKSTVFGITQYKYLEKTFTVANAEPDLSAFLMDINEKTTALTGDSLASLIKGYSNVAYEMSATGLKGASIVSYSAVNGSNTLDTSSGTFNNITDSTFKLSATDNRGLTTTREFTLNLIDYFKPTCSQKAEIEMSGETTATIKIVATGEWSSRHFGAVHNALRVEYRYKVDSGEYGEWVGADYITDNDSYKITFTPEVHYEGSYTVQSRAIDLLDEAITSEYALKLIPVFDWSEDDFNFNVPVNINGDLTIKGSITINGEGGAGDSVIETGTEAMGSNGTWYWEKWSSGKAVCWGVRNFGNMAINKAWGSMYESASFTQDFPTDLFIDIPYFLIHCVRAGGAVFVEQGWNTTTPPTAANTGTFCCYRPTSMTVPQVYLGFYAIGRWK